MNGKSIKYLKESEVAYITGIAIQTLRNHRTTNKGTGLIPYIRLKKKIIRYDIRDIEEFMESKKVK